MCIRDRYQAPPQGAQQPPQQGQGRPPAQPQGQYQAPPQGAQQRPQPVSYTHLISESQEEQLLENLQEYALCVAELQELEVA